MTVQIDHALEEIRRFRPSPEFAAQAVADARPLRGRAPPTASASGPTRPASCCTGTSPSPGPSTGRTRRSRSGSTTASSTSPYNCLDRHVAAGNGDRVAIHWEGEPGDSRDITYAELTAEVKRAANVLDEPRHRRAATASPSTCR